MARYYTIPFLLPPGVFVAFLVLSGAAQLVKKRYRAGTALAAAGLLLWSLSTSPVADSLLWGLEARFGDAPVPSGGGDCIVLLGGGVHDGAPDLSGPGTLGEETAERVLSAVRLQRTTGLPVVVTGGAVFPGRAPEAPIMRRILIDLGVPAGRIITEEGSRDTRENAQASARICRARGYGRPILVTSAFHLRRAVMLFRKAGLDVIPCPAGMKTWKGKRYSPVDYLPQAAALRHSSIAIREYIALAVQGLS